MIRLSTVFLAFILLSACAETPVGRADTADSPEFGQPSIHKIEETIFFDFDSSVVSKQEKAKLQDLLSKIRIPGSTIQLHGHSDEAGDNVYNLKLARQRAKAIKKILKLWGVPASSIKLFTWGEEIPADETETRKAQISNRRVEIVIVP
ncbi:MAG: OmpA family protein [Gammaproteobacteria bacterium]|nr:OmpA family protein [Gammaproteobacteria bacterium]